MSSLLSKADLFEFDAISIQRAHEVVDPIPITFHILWTSAEAFDLHNCTNLFDPEI